MAKLPPLRKVNHWIPLIDEGKQYAYHLPCCPDSLKPQLVEKIQLYTSAKWWIMASVLQVAPMLCILKKMGKLRTVINCRKGEHWKTCHPAGFMLKKLTDTQHNYQTFE